MSDSIYILIRLENSFICMESDFPVEVVFLFILVREDMTEGLKKFKVLKGM